MKRLSIFAVVALSGFVVFAQSQKFTVTVESETCPPEKAGKQVENNPRKVALVVQNHAALGANIPIIAMTANAFEEDKKRAFDSGMDDYLSKPIHAEVLFDTVSRILGSRKER